MSESFKDFLTERAVDSDTIHQAARFYLAERTDDMDEEEMKEELVRQAGDPDAVEAALRLLERDSAALENAGLALLSAAWDDPQERERVKGAIEGAKKQMPIIEIAILAIVGMYGMYLVKTGGKQRVTKVVKRNPDGSLEETEITEYHKPSEPLSAVVSTIK